MPIHPMALGLAVAALTITGWSAPLLTPPSVYRSTPPSTPAPTTSGPAAVWPVQGGTVLRGYDAPATYAPGHRGVDLSAVAGQPVRSALAGRVSVAGQVAGRPLVVVDHAGGLRTTYLPVRPAVEIGQHLERGAVVGRLSNDTHCGATGCLHWGARRGDEYLDPLTLIGATKRVVLLPDDPAS